jgi:very-short-patch-repair endonuclease
MLICQYCAKVSKNKNGHSNHQRLCPKNVNRVYKNGMLGKKGSNHWIKAKEIGEPYVLTDESRKKMSNSSTGRKHSDNTKKKLSEIRKKFIDENPNKVPYLLNHSSKISYPEKYFLDCFSDIVQDIEFQFQVFRYKLDFANPKEKLYFEIDGDQHYYDKKIIDHDIIRNNNLKEIGWHGIRLRWSHFKKMSEEEKRNKILEIRHLMKW